MPKYTLTYEAPFLHYREPEDSSPLYVDMQKHAWGLEAENDVDAVSRAKQFLGKLPNRFVTFRNETRYARLLKLEREIPLDVSDEQVEASGSKAVASISSRGNYSFYYQREGYAVFALDWNFWPDKKGQWAASMKEGVRWDPYPETEKVMHVALLNHFGLSNWASEYSLERIRVMSPRRLAEERGWREHKHGLSYLEIRSNTVGYEVLATNHVD